MNVLIAAGLAASFAATGAPEPAAASDAVERIAPAAVVEPARAVDVAPRLVHVDQEQIAASHAATAAAAAAQPRRGGFIWTVAAIVVAGVILAIIL